jgi:transcriptional regulator of arginine metabolism
VSSKPVRQQAILGLINRNEVASQEDLRRLLEAAGHRVTQATLSRDLRELGIVRAPTTTGPRYVQPDALSAEDVPSLEALMPELFESVDGVRELLVLRTSASGAQPIAEAIDAANWPDVLGTVAGDSTILIICRSEESRLALSAGPLGAPHKAGGVERANYVRRVG